MKGSDESQSEFDEIELYDERLTNTAISDSVHLQNEYLSWYFPGNSRFFPYFLPVASLTRFPTPVYPKLPGQSRVGYMGHDSPITENSENK